MSSGQSNFEKIVEFHQCSGLDYNTAPQLNIVKKNPDLVKLRKDLIDEELSELIEAVENHDFTETIDALADILYVAYGACASFGINANRAYHVYDNVKYQLQPNITKENPNMVSLRLSDIQTQVEYLHRAIENGNDFYNIKKSLFGIIRYTYRACISFGINPTLAFGLVHVSNMTKFPSTEEEADQTVESYKSDTRYDTPTWRRKTDSKYYVVYNLSTGKILKCINYKPVSFQCMFDEYEKNIQTNPNVIELSQNNVQVAVERIEENNTNLSGEQLQGMIP